VPAKAHSLEGTLIIMYSVSYFVHYICIYAINYIRPAGLEEDSEDAVAWSKEVKIVQVGNSHDVADSVSK